MQRWAGAGGFPEHCNNVVEAEGGVAVVVARCNEVVAGAIGAGKRGGVEEAGASDLILDVAGFRLRGVAHGDKRAEVGENMQAGEDVEAEGNGRGRQDD